MPDSDSAGAPSDSATAPAEPVPDSDSAGAPSDSATAPAEPVPDSDSAGAPSDTAIAPSESEPSQSAEAARAQGVAPALAELSFADRIGDPADLSRLEDHEFVDVGRSTWMVSDLRGVAERGVIELGGCLGPTDGAWITERVCAFSYSEIVEVVRDADHNPQIARAYPIYSGRVSMIHATEDAIYCFRAGDGALPHSVLCRIDLETGDYIERWWPAPDPASPSDDPEFVAWSRGPVFDYLTVEPAEQVCAHDMPSVDPVVDSVPVGARFVHVDPDTLELQGCEPYPAGTYG